MNTATDNFSASYLKEGTTSVSILDESLWSNPPRRSKICLYISPVNIVVSIHDAGKNIFLGLEAFHFSKALDEKNLVEKLDGLSIISALLKKVAFNSVSICLQNNLYTFVPPGLFKVVDAGKYFRFNHEAKDDCIIESQKVRAYDIVNVFGVSKIIHDALKRMFENFILHHHATALLEGLHLQYKSKTEKMLFLNIGQESFEVIITEGKKLLLCNSFTYKSVEDLLYYVLFVCEQLSVNPETVETILTGEIEKESAIYKLLIKYMGNVNFSKRLNAVEYSYGFNELPSHFYYSVFSQVLCES